MRTVRRLLLLLLLLLLRLSLAFPLVAWQHHLHPLSSASSCLQ
jgi:hypothetical protein